MDACNDILNLLRSTSSPGNLLQKTAKKKQATGVQRGMGKAEERRNELWTEKRELLRERSSTIGNNRKYLFVPKTTKQSIQHKNHTIYYI